MGSQKNREKIGMGGKKDIEITGENDLQGIELLSVLKKKSSVVG